MIKIAAVFHILCIAVAISADSLDPAKADLAVNQRLTLDKIDLEVPLNQLQAVPSFEACSLYLKQAPLPDDNAVRFRRSGETEWRKAYKLIRCTDTGMLRGSIVNLHEDTDYEVQVTCGDKKYEAGFRTRSSKPVVKKIVKLKNTPEDQSIIISGRGTPDAWIKYTAEPGTVLKKSTKTGAAIRIRDARCVILEGVTIEGGQNGISVENSQDIRIVNCNISRYGRVGSQDVRRRDEDSGKFFSQDGMMINVDAGIRIAGSGNLLIERCYIHDPLADTNTWRFQHPAGPNGILFYYCTGGVVLRYNDIVGNDGNRWNDAAGGYSNWAYGSGLYRDADVYGNLLSFANDDGLELDGGQVNMRVFLNKFEQCLSGISTGPCMLGPSFIFRNLFTDLGDVDGVCNYAFKNRHQRYDPGQLLVFNNTIHIDSNAYGPYNVKNKSRHGELKGITRNNIFHANGFFHIAALSRKNDFDYDLFFSLDQNITAKAQSELRRLKLERNALFGIDPGFSDSLHGNFNLSDGSPARKRGIEIPNFMAGRRPDLGAFQTGEELELPYRPVPVRTGISRLEFKPEEDPVKTVRLTVDSVPGFEENFTICKSRADDWFEVTPAVGTLRSGDRLDLQVRLKPEALKKPGPRRGIFLVRLANGYSRPVSVYSNVDGEPVKTVNPGFTAIYLEAEKPSSAQEFAVVEDIDASERKYVLFDAAKEGRYQTYEFEIPAEDEYFILVRVRAAGMPADHHNTLLAALDEQDEFVQFFQISQQWLWGGFDFSRGSRRIQSVKLSPGKHTLRLGPRKKGSVQADMLLITNDISLFSQQNGVD